MRATITHLAALTFFLLGLTSPVQAGPALIVEGEGDGECADNPVASPCVALYNVTVDGEERMIQATSVNATATAGPPPVFNLTSDGHVLHTNYPACWDFDVPFDSCQCDNGECDAESSDISCTGDDDCIHTATRFNDQTKCGAEGFDFVEEFCLSFTFNTREPITGGTGAFAGAEGQFHQHGEGEFAPGFIFSSSLRGVISVE